MADNPTVDNGALTDYVVSADEAVSGYVQRVKLVLSADGSDTHLLVDANGLLAQVQGVVASGVADSGNPLKVGGVYKATPPALTDGQRTDAVTDARGNLGITVRQGLNTAVVAGQGSDGLSAGGTVALFVGAQGYVFNGTTFDRVRSDGTTGGQGVGGTVASAATDSGNPVKVGAKYNASLPTFTDGQRGDLQIGTRGSLDVTLYAKDSASAVGITSPADGLTAQVSLGAIAQSMLFNGSTWDRQRSDGTTGGAAVGGSVASGSTDSGNPIKIGGKYNASAITLTDGQRGDAQLNINGSLIVGGLTTVADGAGTTTGAGVTAGSSGTARPWAMAPYLYNSGSSAMNLQRSNESVTLLASAARTATTSSADQTNVNARGVLIVVNVTAETGTTTLTLTVEGKDSISSNYYSLIAGVVVYDASADTPTTTRGVLIYPGALNADARGAGATNLIAAKSLALPRTWRATITPSDASSQTYSVSAATIL